MKTNIITNTKVGFSLLFTGAMLLSLTANAQRSVGAAGGSATIGGDLYAYSIGEMVLVSTETGGNLTVTQGVLQPAGFNLSIEEQTLLESSLKLYPNPVANTLYLQPNLTGGGELSLQLFDLRGRLILKRKLNLQAGTERQQLDLSFLQEGNYLLKATLQQDNRSYDHSFKILKKGS